MKRILLVLSFLIVLFLSACDFIDKSEPLEVEEDIIENPVASDKPYPGDHVVVLDNIFDSFKTAFTKIEYTELTSELCFTINARDLDYKAGEISQSNYYYYVVHEGTRLKSVSELSLSGTSIYSRHCFDDFSEMLEYKVDFGVSPFPVTSGYTDIILIDGFTSQSYNIKGIGRFSDNHIVTSVYSDYIEFGYILGNVNLNFESIRIEITTQKGNLIKILNYDNLVETDDFILEDVVIDDLSPQNAYKILIYFTGNDNDNFYEDRLVIEFDFTTIGGILD